MTTGTNEMLIDAVMANFDATIIEHIVVDASPDCVYEAAREMDFMQVHSPLVDAVMLVRGLPARIGHNGAPPNETVEAPTSGYEARESVTGSS